MTAIGVMVDRDRAVLWADTQVFRDGVPSRHAPKLFVNPTARVAGCGTGWHALLRHAGHAVTAATCIHDLAEELPTLLRHQAARVADWRADPETFAENIYLAAGWSARYRRAVGYVFAATDYFAPTMVRTFASPPVPGIEAMEGREEELHGVVVEQLAELERIYDCTIGGNVIAATISRNEVAARVLVSLAGASAATPEARAAALLE
ncbi:MAG TPA: hypothetical protein VMA37_01500 [Acetobacteraceae bacterium]|nr:hypothetical protein [Acetobacteraceae bacterium]